MTWVAWPSRWLWSAWVFSLVAGITALVAGGWYATRAHQQTEEVLRQLQVVTPPATIVAAADTDFAATMGHGVTAARLLAILDASARGAGVVVASVTVADSPASLTELGRLEATLVLNGTYVASKRVLVELFDRLPTASVKRLKMMPANRETGLVQSTLLLSVWSAPTLALSAGKP